MRRRRRGGLALALIGIGIGVVSVAFTLSPPEHVAGAIFWATFALGALVILLGAALLLGRKPAAKGPSEEEMLKRRLLAAECRRISSSLGDFIVEWKRSRPRPRPFRDGDIQLRRWHREGEERYQETFRVWALNVFDAAVQLDGVAPESRVFIDAPSFEHLDQIPGLFRDAALSLDSGLGEMSRFLPSLEAPPTRSPAR
jgi:hypothetical protein